MLYPAELRAPFPQGESNKAEAHAKSRRKSWPTLLAIKMNGVPRGTPHSSEGPFSEAVQRFRNSPQECA